MAVKPQRIRTEVRSLDEVRRSLQQIDSVLQSTVSQPVGPLDVVLRDGSLSLTDDWANRGRRIRETGVAEVRSDTPISPATGLFWLDISGGGTVLKLFDSSAWISFALASHVHAASDITTGQLALARGGTAADLSATGGTSQVLQQTSGGAAITVGQLASSNLSDTANILLADGSVALSSAWAANNDITGLTKLVVDNITLNGNQITGTAGQNLNLLTSGAGVLTLTSAVTIVWNGPDFAFVVAGFQDILLTFDATSQDGTLTYRDAEDRFDFGSAVDVAGNITLTGTVDGVDIATDVIVRDGSIPFTGTIAGIDPTASNHLATKEYVDKSVSFIQAFFLNNTASDIGGIYYDMEDPTGEAESSFTTAGLGTGDDQALVNWATLAGVPGVTVFKAGVYAAHIHAEKTVGTKPVQIYFEVYTRTSGGAETLRATSEISDLITSKTHINLHANVAMQIAINDTDRIVVKWYANVGTTGSAATVVLYAEGTDNARFAIPTTTEILSTVFLRQDGTTELSADWDAGSFKITAEQLESDVANGTAPLVIASTDVVANLNADLLDGNHAAAFGDVTAAANITDHAIVRGDGGAKGIQDSGITIDDSDNITGANSITLADDKEFIFGSSTDAKFLWDTSGARHQLVLGVTVGAADQSGYILIMEAADIGNANRVAPGLALDPIVRIYSSDVGQLADYIQISHDQTNAVISWGNGILSLAGGTVDIDSGNLTLTGGGTVDGVDIAAHAADDDAHHNENHALLDGSQHNDTASDAPTRGSIIYGNGEPKWDELLVGSDGQYLGTDGTDAAWQGLDIVDDATPQLGGNLDTNTKTISDSGGDINLADNLDFNEFKAIAMVCDNGATLPAGPTNGQWFLHTPTGRNILFMYCGGVWCAIVSFGSMTVYVDKTDGTDDQDGGTAVDGDAFATVQFAVDQIPGLVGGNVVININNETYAESVTVQGKAFAGNYNILFEGQFAEQLSETTASGGTIGSTQVQATMTVAGTPWGVNDYQYMWVKFEDDTTTAVLRGQELLIASNTNNTITFLNMVDAAPVNGDTFTIQDQDTEWGMTASGTEPILTVEVGQARVDCHRIYFLETTEVPTLWIVAYQANSSGRWDACRLTQDTRLQQILVGGGSLFLQDCFIDGARAAGTRCIVGENGGSITINHTLVRSLNNTTTSNRIVYIHSNSILNVTGSMITRGRYGIYCELGASARVSGSNNVEGELRTTDCNTGWYAQRGGLIGITLGVFSGNTTDKDPAAASDPAWIKS